MAFRSVAMLNIYVLKAGSEFVTLSDLKIGSLRKASSPCTIQANYLVAEWVRTVLKSKQKITVSLLYARVVVKT